MFNAYNDVKWAQCKSRIDFDNQLGFIHNMLKYCEEQGTQHFPKGSDLSSKVRSRSFTKEGQAIYEYGDVVEDKLAQQCHDFLCNVTLDLTKPLINDTSERPKNIVYYDAVKRSKERSKIQVRSHNPLDWEWVHYSDEIWRLAPKTLEAFYNSPIYTLISVLEDQIRQRYQFASNIYKSCWVLQLITSGNSCGAHRDDNGRRLLAFIYYLNDDWSCEDGGQLCALDTEDENDPDKHNFIYLPSLNTMIVWDMRTKKSPLHWVQETKRNRYALVGFFEADNLTEYALDDRDNWTKIRG